MAGRIVNLVRDRGGLGDMVCVLGAAESLRYHELAKDIRIWTLREYRDLVEYAGFDFRACWRVGEKLPPMDGDVIELDGPERQHEIETHGRPWLSRTALFCRACGAPDVACHLVENKDERARGFHLRDAIGPYVVVAPQSAADVRTYPLGSLPAMLAMLQERGLRPVIMGSEFVRFEANPILLPRLAFRDIAAWMFGAAAVIAVDSGLLHVACALRRPVLGLFGPTSAALTMGQYGYSGSWLQGEPCDGVHFCPCQMNNGNGFGLPPCHVSEGCAALNSITPEAVLAELDRMMGKGARKETTP